MRRRRSLPLDALCLVKADAPVPRFRLDEVLQVLLLVHGQRWVATRLKSQRLGALLPLKHTKPALRGVLGRRSIKGDAVGLIVGGGLRGDGNVAPLQVPNTRGDAQRGTKHINASDRHVFHKFSSKQRQKYPS